MNEIVFEGKIEEMTPVRNYNDRNGQQHASREILVATDEMYPQRVLVELQEGNATLPLSVGQKVRCYLNFRTSRSATSERIFNNIRAWKIDF